ncbi:MAG TPA: YdeI/OmpD-associated family protein [Candidatus Dormibacteraeota bacterium]|jgi:hypothetical protein|nr:YdeI/OmpD-associated family protein [Candidatus Dormibacteraeota bacterium]
MADSTFDATLEEVPGGGAFVELPAEVIARIGGRKVRVRGTVNGTTFQSSTMPTREGGAHLGLHKATRLAAGISFGDRVSLEVERDDAVRTVEVPPELERALAAEPSLRETFEGLSFTNRRELAEAITGAKREDTRDRRLAQTLEHLRQRRDA